MPQRVKNAVLSSGDDDEANMDIILPDEEEVHELDFHEYGDGEEPSTEDDLEFDELDDDYSIDEWE